MVSSSFDEFETKIPALQSCYHCSTRAVNVTVIDDMLSVDLEDGRTIAVPIGWYPRLALGTPAERAHVQISGAGYGLHWPELDEDIGVEGLLLGKKSTESAASFERWLQRRHAR
jgi:hypothetical protein